MASVDVETAALTPILNEMLDLVRQGGGVVHANARIQERGGQFSVHADGPPGDDEPLFFLPSPVLVPVGGVKWDERADLLAVRAVPEGLSALQVRLLELQVELYNAVGKAPWARKQLPALVVSDHPDLLEAVRAVRPGFRDKARSVAEVFIGSRVFDYDAAEDLGPGSSTEVLMPLIDFLNHHPMGSRFQVDASGIRVDMVRPVAASQCFVRYGNRRGVLNLALSYGFLDRHNPWAASTRLEVVVPGIGRVCVEGLALLPNQAVDAPRIEFRADGVVLSHVTVNRSRPEESRVVLRLGLLGAARRRGLDQRAAERAADHAIAAILDENLALLRRLESRAEASKGTPHMGALLAEATRIEGANLASLLAESPAG
jgi:hypothetical protein